MNTALTIDAECDTAERVRRIRQNTRNCGGFSIQAAALRRFMAANPGLTHSEIKARHPVKDGTFTYLQKRKLARFEGGGKSGPAKWFAVPM